MPDYDLYLFQIINNLAGRNALFDLLGVFLAEYLAFILLALLCALWFYPRKEKLKNRTMIVTAFISVFTSRYILKVFIVLFYARPRPYVALAPVHRLISSTASENLQSFPSGHALIFFSISMSIYFFNRKLGLIFFIASAIMGIARIYVGVHWPSDILAGAILGILVSSLVHFVYQKYRPSKKLGKWRS